MRCQDLKVLLAVARRKLDHDGAGIEAEPLWAIAVRPPSVDTGLCSIGTVSVSPHRQIFSGGCAFRAQRAIGRVPIAGLRSGKPGSSRKNEAASDDTDAVGVLTFQKTADKRCCNVDDQEPTIVPDTCCYRRWRGFLVSASRAWIWAPAGCTLVADEHNPTEKILRCATQLTPQCCKDPVSTDGEGGQQSPQWVRLDFPAPS